MAEKTSRQYRVLRYEGGGSGLQQALNDLGEVGWAWAEGDIQHSPGGIRAIIVLHRAIEPPMYYTYFGSKNPPGVAESIELPSESRWPRTDPFGQLLGLGPKEEDDDHTAHLQRPEREDL